MLTGIIIGAIATLVIEALLFGGGVLWLDWAVNDYPWRRKKVE